MSYEGAGVVSEKSENDNLGSAADVWSARKG